MVTGSPNREHEFVRFATGTNPFSGMQDVTYGPGVGPQRRSSHWRAEPICPTTDIDQGLKAEDGGQFASILGTAYTSYSRASIGDQSIRSAITWPEVRGEGAPLVAVGVVHAASSRLTGLLVRST